MKKNKPNVISLYSGAGGLDVGLEEAGYHIAVAVDFDHDSCETLRLNLKETEVIEGDIQQVTSEEILSKAKLTKGEADILVGGPPCQPFSKSAFWNGSKGLADPRAVTLKEYVRVLKDTDPKFFILENVFGLSYKNNDDAFSFLKTEFHKLGYEINYKVLNTADFGVPQIRQRLIIIGSKRGKVDFPSPTHKNPDKKIGSTLFSDKELPNYLTAKDAFKGLRSTFEEVPKELKVEGK